MRTKLHALMDLRRKLYLSEVPDYDAIEKAHHKIHALVDSIRGEKDAARKKLLSTTVKLPKFM